MVEDRDPRRRDEGRLEICLRMLEVARSTPHFVDVSLLNDERRERRVATSETLAEDDEVGSQRGSMAGEEGATTSGPAEHLVGDDEDAVSIAEMPDALEVPTGGHRRARRGTDDRFDDEGGDRARTFAFDQALEVAYVVLGAVASVV